MQNAYVSLVDMREKALEALNTYRIIRYGTAEPIGEDEIRTISEVPFESRKAIMATIPSATNVYNDYFKVYGALQPIQEVLEETGISKWGRIAEWAEANRIQCIAWFTYMHVFGRTTNVYSIDLNPTHFTFEPTDRMVDNKTNTEVVLENLVKIYPTREDLLNGRSRFNNWLQSCKHNAERYARDAEKKETGLEKILKDGPAVNTLKEHQDVENDLQDIIKALPTNGLTSRTWGFEVEVPDCKGVEPIPGSGIEKGDDGSLRSYESSEDCECDCDDCTYHDCDCEWCDNRNDDPDHCGNSACATAESAEYRSIGGIQRIKHNGLYDLCAKLKEVEAEMNDSAGTHIHVFAADLTTNQVGQVFAIYKRLENVFTVIAGRSHTSYANVIPVDYVRYMIRRSDPRIPTDKPRAINATHIFNERGTLEFRQMDCNLNADRITAWAWLMRGLVETVNRGAKMQDFFSVQSLKDIVEVYAKFGFFAHDEQPGLVVPGSKTDKNSVKLPVHVSQ